MAKNCSFTVRLAPNDATIVETIAALRGVKPGVQMREMILAGMKKMLDPAEIEREIEAEKRFLLEAAARVRQRRGDGQEN
jgi:hypothetical protein